MIPQLLSFFNPYPEEYCNISKVGKSNLFQRTFVNFYYGLRALYIFTLFWIAYEVKNYIDISVRPMELFAPVNYLGRLLMPSFPTTEVFFGVAIISFALTIYLLFNPQKIVLKVFLTLGLLWLNMCQWSFGFESAVGHLFLAAHLFSIFVPLEPGKNLEDKGKIHKIISWFYLGLLIPYFFSGFYKYGGLIYKLFVKREDINWLNPKGALYTSISSFRHYDFDFLAMEKYFSFPLFWQISFLLMNTIQILGPLAAFRLPLTMWIGICLMILHTVNFLAFSTLFVVAPAIILCIFFPYYILFKNHKYFIPHSSTNFKGKKEKAIYARIYSNNIEDTYKGFYAYREQFIDKRPFLGGLIYTPGLATLLKYWWKLTDRSNRKAVKSEVLEF